MKILRPMFILFVLMCETPAFAQHHMGSWVLRTATDTTVVQCLTDSLTAIGFPPNSMSMMMPDSLYCRIDRKRMDSLTIPYDSSFIGWCRVQAGSDGMHFDMMNSDSIYGHHNMMQFMNSPHCTIHWDSLQADSAHRHWHPTGVKGWDGTTWVSLPGVFVSGASATFSNKQIYSAIAFVGAPSNPTAVADGNAISEDFALYANYPNPFNPSTTIRYAIAQHSHVTLTVYNTLGQKVAELLNAEKGAGTYDLTFNANGLASGVYLYRIQAGGFVQTKKLVLLR